MDWNKKVHPAISAAVLLGGLFVAGSLYLMNQAIVLSDTFAPLDYEDIEAVERASKRLDHINPARGKTY